MRRAVHRLASSSSDLARNRASCGELNLLQQFLDSHHHFLLMDDSALDDIEDLDKRKLERAVVLVHLVCLEPKMNPVEEDIGQKVVQGGKGLEIHGDDRSRSDE